MKASTILKSIVCIFKGHIRIRKTVETKLSFHKFSCERCGRVLDVGILKNIQPPPGIGKEEWEVYKLEMINNYLAR